MGWTSICVVLGNLFIYMCSGGGTGWCVVSLCMFWGFYSGVNKDAVCVGLLILKSRRWRWHVSLKHWGNSRTIYPVTQWNIPEICNPLLVYFQITWLSRVSIFSDFVTWRGCDMWWRRKYQHDYMFCIVLYFYLVQISYIW